MTYDRALFYVKGGVAWAQTTYAATLNLGGLASFTTSVDETRIGALFGTGIEYAFLPGWSAKVEYNYIDFGKDDFNFAVGPMHRRNRHSRENASCEGGSELQVRRLRRPLLT